MQRAVPRDAQGRSEYAMISVNPMRVGSHITETHLKNIVDAVEKKTDLLLQIVNYNMLGMQYIVAGKIQALVVLDLVMTALMQNPAGLQTIDDIITTSMATVEERVRGLAPGAVLAVERGKTTIPISGIDVPFHSKFLLSGVDSFRKTLAERISPADPALLIGRYVPNLTARVFELSKEYFLHVWDITRSPIIEEVLADWDARSANAPELCRTLLIELLSYQFASPVQWIKTQEYFFTSGHVKRVIEIGPTPILKGMALRTLATGAYGSPSSRVVYHSIQDRDEIYCARDHQGPTCEEAAKADLPPVVEEVSEEPAPVAPVAAPLAVPVSAPAPCATVPERPITAWEVLQVTLALKLRKNLEEVTENSTVKELSGGKSALQNEIMGDLAQEFGDHAPESALEMPLSELAKTFTSYNSMGKFTTECLTKLVTAKMPGGFGMSSMKKYIAEEYNLGQGRLEGVCVHMLTMSPGERMATETEAHQWIQGVVESYGTRMGVHISKGMAGGGDQSGMLAAIMALMGSGQPAPIPDASVTAKEFIKVVWSQKLKLPLSSVQDDKCLNDLTGGKSALQNEILGDLNAEFGEISDSAASTCIGDLATQFPHYGTLGKTSMTLVSRLFSSKVGHLAMSAVKKYLAEKRALPPGRVDSVLLHALTMEPAAVLPDVSSSEKWLDSVVDAFCAAHNLVVPRGGTISLGDLGGSSKAVDALEKRFYQLLEASVDNQMEFLGCDKFSSVRECQTEVLVRHAVEKELAQWIAEHGDFYAAGIQPLFHAAKERRYDSFWNWSRADVLALVHMWREGEHSHERMCRIANRGTKELEELLAGLETSDASLKQFLEELGANVRDRHGGVFFRSQAPHTWVDDAGRIEYEEIAREGIASVEDFIEEMKRGFQGIEVESTRKSHRPPRITSHIYMETSSRKQPTVRQVDDEALEDYFSAMRDLAQEGISLADKVVLITGCGIGSIGISLVKYLLQAGAHVIATTSSFTLERTYFYRAVYEEYCADSAVLTLLPFNQASAQDVTSLVAHVYDSMGVDVDFVVPFAAISENGSDISGIEGRSELSHRIMLTNTVRLLGAIKAKKEERNIVTHPAVAFLPLSPNHGIFGNDGLYSESKLGLEALLAKSVTEGWSDYVSVVGVVIGWTRGTGLMSGNNMVAQSLEAQGLRTFSMEEMAFCLLALFHPNIVALSHECPIVANLGGGINLVSDLKHESMATRADIFATAAIRRRVKADTVADDRVLHGQIADDTTAVKQAANVRGTAFPTLPTSVEVGALAKELRQMVDLEKMVVCVGYGEVGPWSSARTRWEMESYGHLSLEGCVELAWMLGYIRYHNGPLAGKDHDIYM